MEIIFESKMNEVFHSNIQEGIRHYYDDLDFKNILDFVQEKFSCCGGDEFRDWEVNQYHACNGSGALACGVPHSCCVRGAPGGVVNTLCGYRALDKQRLELIGTIHVRGCIHAVGLWLKDNFQATLAIVCSLLLPQVCGGSFRNSLLDSWNSQLDRPTRDELPVLGFSAPAPARGAGLRAQLLSLCWRVEKKSFGIPIPNGICGWGRKSHPWQSGLGFLLESKIWDPGTAPGSKSSKSCHICPPSPQQTEREWDSR
ncbi:tetraspanin-15-like isoform X2 [Oenanthe melanoleuca]|uniref:tetraspanin-15-like isoform X2 n=1 Tax=Oenanthe melanoleuca TaxID=2939378 RepID=UPI0024C162ED|nr:tetraspanin-15-like isoform X2 [Oenanthe melanoleuca]